jgi:hypothetical protein
MIQALARAGAKKGIPSASDVGGAVGMMGARILLGLTFPIEIVAKMLVLQFFFMAIGVYLFADFVEGAISFLTFGLVNLNFSQGLLSGLGIAFFLNAGVVILMAVIWTVYFALFMSPKLSYTEWIAFIGGTLLSLAFFCVPLPSLTIGLSFIMISRAFASAGFGTPQKKSS